MEYFLLIIGFFLLIKGADIFVDGAASIAKKLGIPSVIVGLTIVSLGTSAPELSVSLISSINGSNEMAVGNVLGSNIFNILMVLGVTNIIKPMALKKSLIKRDYIINIIATILAFLLIFVIGKGEYSLSRIDGIILIILLLIYIGMLIFAVKGKRIEEKEVDKNINILKSIILCILGIIGIIWGGDLVVDSATVIAYSLGMSEKLVGLTIVAIGTSLPELVTSVVALLKGEGDMAIGNVLGSNIFNLLLILGISSSISPIVVSSSLSFDFLFLIGVTLFIGGLIFFNRKEEKKISRFQGAILVLLYVIYTIYIIMRN